MVKVSIDFVVEVQSALHIGQASLGVGEYQFTQRHLPGSALRGALAEVMLKHGQPTDPDFYQLFEGPTALRFEPAYPAGETAPAHPFPLTARACKAHGGFPPPDTAQQEQRENYHGAFDILIRQVAFEEQLEAFTRQGMPLPWIDEVRCPHCQRGVEPHSGTYIWNGVNDPPTHPPRHELVRHTHTAINRARGAAEDGMLYTLEAIEPGAVLRGRVWVEPADVGRIREELGRIRHLGRGVTRGQGRVKIEPLTTSAPDDLDVRIQCLTTLFHTERELYARLSGQPVPSDDSHYFTLDLVAPAILGDGTMATLLPGPIGSLAGTTLVRRFTAPEVVGGWWNAAKAPYPTALAVASGSVLFYRAPAAISLDSLCTALQEVQAAGIGQQCERGYGAVLPCAPFHLWTAEKEAKRK